MKLLFKIVLYASMGGIIGASIGNFLIVPALHYWIDKHKDKAHLDGKAAYVDGRKYILKCSIGQVYSLDSTKF
ncbi:hypothetical protein SAMN05192529_102148 [Arachidicoccus rhizosphaerae]|uniref:Uncharacterized protein n=1 Tax=Arachidicoccus rhizosphaerae TaxID=551991 RepID=A0A1H3W5N4_9BACT|nr:hypothetical protein [Arachidicoccus rhizosphaerae]SDZ82310.1 hypothetical protein SAMN05192529_102148 [Arachidicoccus rhizosphaerae]